MKKLPILLLSTATCLLLSCSGGGDQSAGSGTTQAPAQPAEPKAAPIELGEPTNDGPGFLTVFADVDEVMGNTPHSVKLDVDVVDGTGTPPFTYKWDFGDATEFSEDRSPSHTYKIPGSFRASVIVTDSKGQTDQDYVDITVNEDFDYRVTPEQLREAMPVEELAEKVRQRLEEAKKEQAASQAAPAGNEAKPAAPAPQP